MVEPEIDFFEPYQNPSSSSTTTTTVPERGSKRMLEEIEIPILDPTFNFDINEQDFTFEMISASSLPPSKKARIARETNEIDEQYEFFVSEDISSMQSLLFPVQPPKPPKPPKPISLDKQLSQQRLEEAKKVLPPRLHTVWTNLMNSFDRELRRELENHVIDKEYVKLRELGSKRPYLLSIKETELIKHYRNNYPFSCLLLYAISIILDRPFSAIKRKWTEEMQIIRTSSTTSVQKAIRRHCNVLEEAFRSLSNTNANTEELFGPLSKKLHALVQTNRPITPKDLTAEEVKAELKHLRNKIESGKLIDFNTLLVLLEEPQLQIHDGIISISPEKLAQIRQEAKNRRASQQKETTNSIKQTSNSGLENTDKSSHQSSLVRYPRVTSLPQLFVKGDKIIRIWEDISDGKGPFPVRCVNEVDDEAPPQINWLRERIDKTAVGTDTWEFTAGCQCVGSCTDPSTCTCAQEMGKKFPYEPTTGYLTPSWSPGYAIYECNSKCQCSSNCRNRVIQKGEKFRLEIFKTVDKGWGLRTRERIPRGAFVCEYVGEVITNEEVERRSKIYDALGLSYLYDLDFDRSHEAIFTVDATFFGNVSRFINHCCEPNLQNYQVWVDDPNPQKPRIALFAKRDIEPGEELCFDYKFDITTSDNISTSKQLTSNQTSQLTPKKQKTSSKSTECKCGARKCRGILFAY